MKLTTLNDIIFLALHKSITDKDYLAVADIFKKQYGAELELPPYHAEISAYFDARQVLILCDRLPWTIGVIPNHDSELCLAVRTIDLARTFPSRAVATDIKVCLFRKDGKVEPFQRKPADVHL